ncbi:hypothetical protein J2S43_005163 [Catenuloplanes nepalensis]|uniref:DUF559 domain-containing protein n=1 Tax=Catenuloplanes nepalensis TaxID=587533 RepID=A0ABT9MZM8_9ACTN|nr:DUF559 domain-containing protein [Catenuloplanes nepalensis]MDP9796651.1 hypothetical protein [Catenuloplanes nepalensis]
MEHRKRASYGAPRITNQSIDKRILTLGSSRQNSRVTRSPSLPGKLGFIPFRGSDAVASGLITRRQLNTAAWRRLFHDIYIRAAEFAPSDHRMWCEAAALTLPAGAAISGPSAVFLWGAGSPHKRAPVTATIPRTRSLRSQERLTITRGKLLPEDRDSLAGIPVTNPARTAFDVGRLPDRHQAIMALDALLFRKLVTLEQLTALAKARTGWRGVALFTARLADAEPLAESPMETLLRLLITDAGLPRPIAQHEIITRPGRPPFRADLAYPELRIAIEYEGDHHRERTTFRNDITRGRRLEELGWLILRFTADDVLRNPAETIRVITAARRRRGSTP